MFVCVYVLFLHVFNLWQHRTDGAPLTHLSSEASFLTLFTTAPLGSFALEDFKGKLKVPVRHPPFEVLGWPVGGRLDTALQTFCM
jgi:hypothetical protein